MTPMTDAEVVTILKALRASCQLEAGLHGRPEWDAEVYRKRAAACDVALARMEAGPEQPGVGCEDCGLPYESVAWADLCLHADDWAKISPSGDEGGLLCANCMVKRATERGMQNVRATWNSGPFNAPRLPQYADVLERIADVLRDGPYHRLNYEALRLRDELADLRASPPGVRA